MLRASPVYPQQPTFWAMLCLFRVFIPTGDRVVAFHRPLNVIVSGVAPELIVQLDPRQLAVGVAMAIRPDVLGSIKAPYEHRE